MVDVQILETPNANVYAAEMHTFLTQGYRIEHCNSQVIQSEAYNFETLWTAILVKDDRHAQISDSKPKTTSKIIKNKKNGRTDI